MNQSCPAGESPPRFTAGVLPGQFLGAGGSRPATDLGRGAAGFWSFAAGVAVLIAWRLTTGAIAADKITSGRDEVFYWLAILVSNTLGTALGDFLAEHFGRVKKPKPSRRA